MISEQEVTTRTNCFVQYDIAMISEWYLFTIYGLRIIWTNISLEISFRYLAQISQYLLNLYMRFSNAVHKWFLGVMVPSPPGNARVLGSNLRKYKWFFSVCKNCISREETTENWRGWGKAPPPEDSCFKNIFLGYLHDILEISLSELEERVCARLF